MLLSSSLGQTGDKANLVSPVMTVISPMILSFFLFLQPDETDIVAKFEIYETVGGTMQRQLFATYGAERTPTRDWKQHQIELPTGTYALTMLGTIGKQLQSDIALASVTIQSVTDQQASNASAPTPLCE